MNNCPLMSLEVDVPKKSMENEAAIDFMRKIRRYRNLNIDPQLTSLVFKEKNEFVVEWNTSSK